MWDCHFFRISNLKYDFILSLPLHLGHPKKINPSLGDCFGDFSCPIDKFRSRTGQNYRLASLEASPSIFIFGCAVYEYRICNRVYNAASMINADFYHLIDLQIIATVNLIFILFSSIFTGF